jgi:hypothetical protein
MRTSFANRPPASILELIALRLAALVVIALIAQVAPNAPKHERTGECRFAAIGTPATVLFRRQTADDDTIRDMLLHD